MKILTFGEYKDSRNERWVLPADHETRDRNELGAVVVGDAYMSWQKITFSDQLESLSLAFARSLVLEVTDGREAGLSEDQINEAARRIEYGLRDYALAIAEEIISEHLPKTGQRPPRAFYSCPHCKRMFDSHSWNHATQVGFATSENPNPGISSIEWQEAGTSFVCPDKKCNRESVMMDGVLVTYKDQEENRKG